MLVKINTKVWQGFLSPVGGKVCVYQRGSSASVHTNSSELVSINFFSEKLGKKKRSPIPVLVTTYATIAFKTAALGTDVIFLSLHFT